MTYFRFDIYEPNESGTDAVLREVIEFDDEVEEYATVLRLSREVREMHRSEKKIIISPANNESAWVLLERKKGKSPIRFDPEIVKEIHRLCAVDKMAIGKIPAAIYAKFGDERLTCSMVDSILKQKAGLDVEGILDLREAVIKRYESGARRRRFSDEMKEEWVQRHLAGESGTEIGESQGIDPSRVNEHLRKLGIQRYQPGPRPYKEQS